jgi:nucleolar protein 53
VEEDESKRKKRNFERMVKEVSSGDRKLKQTLDQRSDLAGMLRSKSVVMDIEDTSVKRTANGVFDLWGERDEELSQYKAHKTEYGYDEDWYQPMTKKPKLYSEERTAAAIKRSGRKAVEVDAPGSSYHPEYESHQDLLREALEFHTRKANKRRSLVRKMPSFKSQPEPLIFAEEESDDDVAVEGANSVDSDDSESNGKKEKEDHAPRKSKDDRKKEARQRKHLATLAALEKRKQENREWNAFGKMVRELDDTERIRTARKEARDEMEEERQPTKIYRIGPAHYTHQEPEVLLTEELPGNFRGIRSKTSVLEDRFASLQRRNMIESRHRSKRKTNPNTKAFTRYAFREEMDM